MAGGGSLGAGLEAVVLVEGVGAMGVAVTVVGLEAVAKCWKYWKALVGVCSRCYSDQYITNLTVQAFQHSNYTHPH